MKTDRDKYLLWRIVVMANIGIGILSALWSVYWGEWFLAAISGSGAFVFGITLHLANAHYKTSGRP